MVYTKKMIIVLLLTIGVYNIVHPYKDQIISCHRERGGIGHPAKGIGISPEEMIPLSVQGQVVFIIFYLYLIIIRI